MCSIEETECIINVNNKISNRNEVLCLCVQLWAFTVHYTLQNLTPAQHVRININSPRKSRVARELYSKQLITTYQMIGLITSFTLIPISTSLTLLCSSKIFWKSIIAHRFTQFGHFLLHTQCYICVFSTVL